MANPTTKVADVETLAKIAHDVGAMLSIDATFKPSPICFAASNTTRISWFMRTGLPRIWYPQKSSMPLNAPNCRKQKTP
ncbi:hypothetical protein [Paraburkholderia phytofirmans]|uniref:hypothetical protein n=1 Tax=Paraburkholderia phytofirmans TaxID=261302 RepID=UPI0038B7CC84